MQDHAGNSLAGSSSLDFFVLAGDANRDRSVDLTDFSILASNFNHSGKTFSQGDFNYDGNVDLTDFTVLAAKFNTTLASAARASAPLSTVTAIAAPAPATAGSTSLFSTQPLNSSDPMDQLLAY